MAHVSEVLFVDPSVDDIETITGGLRPGVKAIMLDRASPPARQIAHSLDGLRGLDAVHVIAHGAPGRVKFAAGDWSVATLADDCADLAAIGRALDADGELRLWSCDVAAGAAGAAFIAGLAQSSGADVAAASRRIGAAAKGGSWELTAFAQRPSGAPPVTASAIASYQGVLAPPQQLVLTTETAVSIRKLHQR
jgi:uncharacterized protein DUF4347